MTYEALCDPAPHKLPDLSCHCSPIDHSTMRTLELFVPNKPGTLLPEGLRIAENFPHISSWLTLSLSLGLYSNTTFQVRYPLTSLLRISTVSSPPILPTPTLALFSPDST